MADITDLIDLAYNTNAVVDGTVTGAAFWNTDVLNAIKTALNKTNEVIEDEVGTDATAGTLRGRVTDAETSITTLESYVDQDVSIDAGPSFQRVVLASGETGDAYAARQDFVNTLNQALSVRMGIAETDITNLQAYVNQDVSVDADPTFGTITLSGVIHDPTFAASEGWVQDYFNNITGIGDIFDDTNFPTGIVDKSDSTLSFTDATRTLSIQPTGTTFRYYEAGVVYESAGDTLAITNTLGLHFLYYDEGTLSESVNPSGSTIGTIIRTKPLVSIIYWSTTDSKATYVGDERHGIEMSGTTHEYLHNVNGLEYLSGLGIVNLTVGQSGTLAAHAQFGIELGGVADEDLYISISAVASTTGLPIFYMTGAAGEWRKKVNAGFPVYNAPAGRLYWNEYTGGAWQLTETTDNKYILCHVFATTEITTPIIALMGQAEYNNARLARAGATTEVRSLFLDDLPLPELRPLYTVIYKTSDTYTNAVKAVSVAADDGNYVDWRSELVSRVVLTSDDHNLLTNKQGGTTDEYYHWTAAEYAMFDIDPGVTASIITVSAADKVTFGGDVEVLGDTILADVLEVEDKTIEIGVVASPTDITADGGGIILKGATDKTIIWDNANDNWTSSEHLNIADGKEFKINNVSKLTATTLGSTVVNSSLQNLGTQDEDLNLGGYELLKAKTILDQQIAPYYNFNGSSGNILVTDDASFAELFANGGTYICKFNAFSAGENTEAIFFRKGSGTTLYFTGGKWFFYAYFSTTSGSWISTNDIPLEQDSIVVLSYDGSDVTNNPTLYVNGNEVIFEETSTPIGTIIDDTGDLYIGNWVSDSSTFDGNKYFECFLNRELTAAEAISFSSNSQKALDWKDEGGSNVALNVSNMAYYSTGFDSGWTTSPTGFTGVKTSNPAVYVGTADEIVITAGKAYRVEFDITSDNDFPRCTLAASLAGTQWSNYTSLATEGHNVFEILATTSGTGILEFVFGTNTTCTVAVTNLSVTQLGATLVLKGENATDSTWYDSSGNGNDGAVTTATRHNKQDSLQLNKLVLDDGGTIGQAAGPLLTFDDTNNYLEITGCNVGIGTASPAAELDVVGDIKLSGDIIIADGKGVDFSAYTDGSVAGTTTSQLLDDYEEGTWTPADNSGAGLSFTVYDSTYVKIGNKVFVECSITFPSTASSAQINISGLPYTAKGGDDNTGGLFVVGTSSSRADVWLISRSTTNIIPATTADAAVQNSNYSGKVVKLNGSYTV